MKLFMMDKFEEHPWYNLKYSIAEFLIPRLEEYKLKFIEHPDSWEIIRHQKMSKGEEPKYIKRIITKREVNFVIVDRLYALNIY